MEYKQITSRQNPKIKDLVKLRDKKYRHKLDLFIIEGFREIQRAHNANITLLDLYFCAELFKAEQSIELIEELNNANINITELPESVFTKISLREGSDGLIATAKPWHNDLSTLKLTSNPLLVIAEKIEKPGNLGSLVRSVEASGADALILSEPLSDIFNPNVIRNSQGSVFSLPIYESNNQETLKFLKENNIQTIATTPHTDNIYWHCNLNQPTAIIMGNENTGLSDFWLDNSLKAKIPIKGNGDSLNISVAASLFLYESLRQRDT